MSETELNCWRCGASVDAPEGKVGFQAVCDGCGAWLHCCKGCRFYCPGRANDCLIPDTEFIPDREARNFCDEFKAKLPDGKTKVCRTKEDVARDLFGNTDDDDETTGDNPFDRLFKD